MPSSNSASPTEETYQPAFGTGHPYISYGISFSDACAKHVDSTFKASRVYVIVSGSLSRATSYVTQLQNALGHKVVGTRYGMTPHTLWSEVLEVTKDAKSLDADLLVTLGAGSLTDGAKIIALAMANDAQTFDDLKRLRNEGSDWFAPKPGVNPPTVPLVCIPTSLSGGEYSHVGGGTHDRSRRKHLFSAPCAAPALVILDPRLTVSTPPHVWLQSGVRALDHCVEGLCALPPATSAASDACARRGLELLVPNLLRSRREPGDVAARLRCQLGVVEALKTLFLHRVPMGASHAIGHQLGPLGVGHGETSCILLPAVCKYNRSVNAAQQDKVLRVFWDDAEVNGLLTARGLERETAALDSVLDVYITALGMPRSLEAVGVGEDKLEMLAESSLRDSWIRTNPRPIGSRQQVMEILEAVRSRGAEKL